MRIGVLTFWWSQDNYGQLLQCYALQKFLRDAGHDAFLIRYDHTHDYRQNPFRRMLKGLNPVLLAKFLLKKKHRKEVLLEQKKNDRQFDLFRDKYICKTDKVWHSYDDLKLTYPEADCYVVGSDQVWNFTFYRNAAQCKDIIHAYFLDFGKPETKRMSYAASWSVDVLSEDLQNEIAPLLEKFSYVSVREEKGIELCAQCRRNDAEWVYDPTLLLGAEIYRNIYKENQIRKPKNKYLLLYMLNNEFDFDVSTVYSFAEEKKLDVVYVTGNGVIDQRKKFFATIPEWLYLVDNAEYVITNSFHCGVFSVIFHKRFGVVALSGKDAGMNARHESLFEMTRTGDRFLKNDFDVLDNTYEMTDMPFKSTILSALEQSYE
ncbi:MAG: polysaccharide pyruvyl transferase family protein [Treponema sp.]|nr:polysaccharide pyruvyl transferase family protein [Treponema sp.]